MSKLGSEAMASITDRATFILAVLLIVGFGYAPRMTMAQGTSIELSVSQRILADQIVSVFENNSPIIQYGYAEVLGDGRGITAGRAGFTSATGDMYLVVKNYTKLVPDNPLMSYEKRLKALARNWDSSLTGLNGLPEAWEAAANDSTFRAVQDIVVDKLYYDRVSNSLENMG